MREIKYLPEIKMNSTYTCPICDVVCDTFAEAAACREIHLDLTNFKPTHFDNWSNRYNAPMELYFKVGDMTYKYDLHSVIENESEEE